MPQTASQIRVIFVLYVWISHVCVQDILSNYLLNDHQGWTEHVINLDQQ